MAKWLNRSLIQAPRNGTRDHTVSFTPATAGNLLVLVLEAPVTHTVPAGWTRQAQALNLTELSVYTKTAAQGEASFTTTHNASNFPMVAEVLEFPPGTVWVGGVAGSGITLAGPNPTLSGLTGTNLVVGVVGYGDAETAPRGTVWDSGTEDADISVPAAGTDGYVYSSVFVEDSTAGAFAPTGVISPPGLNSTKEALTFAVKVPAQAPIVETAGTVGLTLGLTGAAAPVMDTTGTLGLSAGFTGTAAPIVETTGTFTLNLRLTGTAAPTTTTTGQVGLRLNLTGSATSYNGQARNITVAAALTERNKTGHLTARRWDGHLA